MSARGTPLLCLSAMLVFWPAAANAAVPTETINEQAAEALRKADFQGALSLAAESLLADPRQAKPHYIRAVAFSELGEHAQAVAECDLLLAIEPQSVAALELRGSENFKLGHFAQSVADFDRSIELEPRLGREHWKRGISCYYAGRYEAGREQFESYQTFDDNDVENAVWRFLCMARADDIEAARKDMLRIKQDSRVPMMQVYAMYAGKLSPAEVFQAAEADDLQPGELKQRLFYAHLYVGLYYELLEKPDLALEHVSKAAKQFRIDHYMGDVAAVHAKVLEKQRSQ